MKYCVKCGISVDEEKNRFCPLCNTIILTDAELDSITTDAIKIKESEHKSAKKVKVKKESLSIPGIYYYITLFLSFISIFTLIIIDLAIGFDLTWSLIPIISIIEFFNLVVLPFRRLKKSLYWYITFEAISLVIYFLLLNYLINKELSWSYYVILSIIVVWVYISSILLNKIKGFVLKLVIDFLATSLFVLLVTFGFGNKSVFARLVLPINGLVFIVILIAYLFIKTYIYNWYIIISTLSLNISALCLGIDLIIQRYITGHFALQWSYIVLIVLIPVTIFMFYLDNRYKVHKYLIKKFHV
ncbi:MAG TPA: hypothetical protein VIK84_00605 [Haloplasmataceae bacterium]